jgi:radical SAM superfamily enzyme YgiQ (UPF0313 family)
MQNTIKRIDKNTIIFVSAGLNEPKKNGNPLASYHSYLNYGLLGLASVLDKKNYDVILLHGKFSNPITFAQELLQKIKATPTYPLFLSIPSVFALDWSKSFLKELKAKYPDTKIIVGGRWVVGNDGSWIRKQLENINLVVFGTAEERIEPLLNISDWSNIPISYTDCSKDTTPEKKLSQYPEYNYELMPDFLSFQPSIEVSRGCGSKCSFCLERDMPLMKLKDANQVTREIINTKKVYGRDDITPYFEASSFKPTLSWAKKLNISFKENNLIIKWRTETRVDSLNSKEILTILAETGLKALDIGLETASPTQIIRMKKSDNPNKYLSEASNLLKMCQELNIWAKVNILLYAGENNNTLKETIDWLNEHRTCIKGVSVNPLLVYGHDYNTIKYIEELKSLGAKPTNNNYNDRGYCQMHLSPDISFEYSENIRIKICHSFMTDDDYYDLKSFSYLPPSLTREKFKEIIRNANPKTLPFKRT